MNKKIYITEGQLHLIESMILQESIFEASSMEELKESVKKLILKGFFTASVFAAIVSFYKLNKEQAEYLKSYAESVEDSINSTISEDWDLAADDVEATVYNACAGQCDNDFDTTASNFKLNLKDVSSHRIIAMERTFMKELGLKYGDVVMIEGCGEYDGVYQIQDTMNKRFAGQHKIDILVPNYIKHGKWNNVKLYTLNDKSAMNFYKANMAPSINGK